MKIFIVHASHRLTDHLAHGDGLIVWGFISTLAAQGHELWVAAPQIDLKSAPPPNIHIFELAPKNRNAVYRLLDYIVRSRVLYERLRRSITFDIIHQFNPVVRGYSFGMIGVSIPVVMGPYNGDWPAKQSTGTRLQRVRSNILKKLRVAADVLMQKIASGYLITTPYALNRLPGLSKSSQKVFVVPNGIDETIFSPQSKTAERPTRAAILMIGCATHKGVFTMLDAFERIAATHADVRLEIAGGGPQTAEVEARVKNSKFAKRIILIGSVSRDEMPDCIRAATIVAVPSFGEPYGMVVLEAMATGKPVAGTNAGGIPYLLGLEAGTLFSPGDDRALASIIVDLLENSNRLQAIGNASRKRVLDDFTWDAATRKLTAAYQAVIDLNERSKS